MALTWLNPHVYLDTLILVGCASQRERIVEVEVWIGVVSVVFFVFFFGLGYGARLLSPYRQASKAWNILDALVGVLMIYLAWHLAFG